MRLDRKMGLDTIRVCGLGNDWEYQKATIFASDSQYWKRILPHLASQRSFKSVSAVTAVSHVDIVISESFFNAYNGLASLIRGHGWTWTPLCLI